MKFFTCFRHACYSWHPKQNPYFYLKEILAEDRLKQFIMRMYLTAFIIGLAFLNVTASSVHGQNVTIKARNLELKSVFDEIKKQTGYLFWYEDNLIDKTNKVSIDVSNASIKEALDACLKSQPLTYLINDKTIIIKAKEKGIVQRVIDFFTAIDIKGKVVNENGQALSGATVKIKGTDKAAVTNAGGEFSLLDVPDNAMVQVSYLGYESAEVKAAINMTIILKVMSNELEEVQINAGYYTVTDKERTGSISRVDSKTIAQQPVSNPLAALIGRMPGVNIEQQSGLNGGGFKIEIRGQNSLRNSLTDNGNNPLYLINGVPYPATSLSSSVLSVSGISQLSSPLSSINPNDIESIEILKDADATAIYGSRGANGVVLITTKKAKAGRAKYELGVHQGASVVSSKLKLLNTEQYLAMRDEAFKNDGVTPNAAHYDVNGTWDRKKYTDWQDVLLGGTAHNSNVSASINGGNEFTQFTVGGNYNRSTTVLPVDFANQRASGALSINHSSDNRKFTGIFSVTYALDINKLPKLDLAQYISLPPNAPALYDNTGNLNWALNSGNAATWTNPLSATKQPYTARSGNLITSAQLGYEIIPGLSLRTNLGYTSIRLKEGLLMPIASLAPSPSATGVNRIVFNFLDTWNIEPQLHYTRKLAEGNLDVLIGSTFQSSEQTTETISGQDYTSDLLLNSISAAPTRIALNSSSAYKYAALFGRINYNYQGTYIVNLTGRRDGSSRFGPEKQFANFGAVGAAWIFSKYDAIKNILPVLSFGKLRGSFGITGNDQIPDYGYVETYSATSPYIDGSGLFPTQLANADYSWESNKKLETSIELGFMKDRIILTATWYRNRSSNQLVGYPLPGIAGFPSIQYNLPATVQNTGWEFEVNTINLASRGFKWTSGINLTIPKNKLLSYPGIEGSSYANTYSVGSSLYQQRKYRFLGVDPATGIYKYEDLNGNGSLDVGDRVPTTKSYTSHWFGGISNSFSFKGISLDVFIQAVNKTAQSPFNNNTGMASLPGSMNNQTIDVLRRWQKPGDETDFGKFSQSSVAGGVGASFNQLFNADRYADASFIRIKNVSLSYTFPQRLAEKAGLKNLRLFMQGQNLFTITNYPGDPEVESLKTTPTLRTIIAGLNINL